MYESLTKITIVLCWLSLFSFWAIKIFGGNWFEIMVHNENFIKFSNAVQNTWLKYLVSFIATSISYYLLFGAIFKYIKLPLKHFILYVLTLIVVWTCSNFVPNQIVKMFGGYFLLIILSFIYNRNISRLNGLLCVGLDFVFSTLSMLTRGIQLSLITDFLILFIGSIDLYIMYALYFLYSNLISYKKENKKWHF